jgi:hypothetical protein
MSQRRIGPFLLLAGNILAIVAFFAPWFDVFKLNDPSFPFPKRGYSPWIVLQSGQFGALGAVTWAFLLLILVMALSSLALALAHTALGRSQARSMALAMAVMGLVMMLLFVPAIPFNLSFSWPFLSSDVVYGVYLAVAGFVSVLIGLATLASATARRE